MSHIILAPVHGQDYGSESTLKTEFTKNRPFIADDPFSPFNNKRVTRRELKQAGVTTANIRYNAFKRVAKIKI